MSEDVREHFAAEPGKGHLAERLLAERVNAEGHGNDARVERIDAELAELGWQPAASREEAAAARKAAAPGGDASRQAPAARRRPPRQQATAEKGA